ncbi:hypothetical protein ACU5AX_05835 [Sphingomonas sp. XXL09]
MNVYQIIVILFAALVIATSIGSILMIIRHALFKLKVLWIIGCLFGFIGLGINWTMPNDLILLFGISVPVVMVFKVMMTGQVIVKTGFPIVSLVAFVKASRAGMSEVR